MLVDASTIPPPMGPGPIVPEAPAFWRQHLLPDGETIVISMTTVEGTGTLVALQGDRRIELVRHEGVVLSFPVYSPSGHIVYQQGFAAGGARIPTSLWPVPFDAELTGFREDILKRRYMTKDELRKDELRVVA